MLAIPVELAARVVDGRLAGVPGGVIRRVRADSRQVEAGDLFVALAGARVDGHRFLEDVFARGAVAALVDPARVPPGAGGGGGLVEVPDPLAALGTLAAWHRNRFRPRVCAVTGSVGKTTTKDLVAAVLSGSHRTLKSPGNLNTEVGLPLALLDLEPGHEAAVFELGMRGPGQIRALARWVRPDAAVITNIGLSHLEVLGSQDAIAAAKAEVLDFLPAGGVAVLNGDDAYYPFLSQRVPSDAATLTFGLGPACRIRGEYLGPSPGTGETLGAALRLHDTAGGESADAWIPLLGRHNVRNAVAAAAVGVSFGLSLDACAAGLATAEISAMRMACHRLPDQSLLLDDAYNASSPETMLGALDVLTELPGRRKVAVLGSMLELGPASRDAHSAVGEAAAAARPDLLVTVGEGGGWIAEAAGRSGFPEAALKVCETNQEAVEALREGRRPGDVVLVKGSRGVAMESIVEALRKAS